MYLLHLRCYPCVYFTFEVLTLCILLNNVNHLEVKHVAAIHIRWS